MWFPAIFRTLYIYYIVKLWFLFILLVAPDVGTEVTAVQISKVLSSHVIVYIFNKMEVLVQSDMMCPCIFLDASSFRAYPLYIHTVYLHFSDYLELDVNRGT